MNRLLTASAATLLTIASIAASTAPASAGSVYFGFGGGHGPWFDGYDPWDNHSGYNSGIYVDVSPVIVDGGSDWDAHVDWCEDQYQTYDPSTDLYFYAPGKQKRCNSPYN